MTRDDKNCPPGVIPASPTTQTTSGRRPLPLCDDVTLLPPSVVTPEDSDSTGNSAQALFIPVHNTSGVVTCAMLEGRGPNGSDVPIVAGSEVVLVDLSFMSTESRGRVAANQDDFRSMALNQDATGIVSVFGVSVTNAQRAIDLVAAAVFSANTAASEKAIAAIDCYFINASISATCPEGALDASYSAADIRNPVIIESGRFPSRTSQAEADSQADAEARRLLVCLYPSPAITVTCESAFGMSGVVSDTTTPPYGISRVAEIHLAYGAFLSEVSVDDATRAATAYATGELQCFYLNATAQASCSDPKHLHDRYVNYQSDDTGSDVTVPAGYFASSVSQGAADADAITAATQRLSCEFGNVMVTVTCPPQAVTTPDGGNVIDPSPQSPVISVTVDENTYRSTVSQADADDSANADALGRLSCIYCNPVVLPKCVEDAVLDDIANGNIILPLNAAFSNGSMDTTVGVPADKYCLSSADAAVAAAYADADTPLRVVLAGGAAACLYGNDVLRYKCTPPTIPMGTFGGTDDERTAEFIVSENSVTVTIAQLPVEFSPALPDNVRAKQYANWLALQMAKSTLQCVFYSEAVNVTCADDVGKIGVAPKSKGSDLHPVIIKAGHEFSEDSQSAANELARQYGIGQLDCFYLSRHSRFMCDDNPSTNVTTTPDNRLVYGTGLMTTQDGSYHARTRVDRLSAGSALRPIIVNAGVGYSNESQVDADAQAAAIGLGALDCFWTNVAVIVQCGYTKVLPWNDFNEQALLPITEGDGALSIGIPGAAGAPVYIQGGIFRSTVSRYDATHQMYRQAVASLNCVWASTDLEARCEAKSMADGGQAPWDATAKTAIVAPAGLQLSFESIADANQKAFQVVNKELSCVYTHEDQERNAAGGGGAGSGGSGPPPGKPEIGNKCENGETAVGTLKVAKGLFKALDPDSPTKMARDHIKANQQCVAMSSSETPYGWSVVSLGKDETPPNESAAGCKTMVNPRATLRLSSGSLTDLATVTGQSDIRTLKNGEYLRLVVKTKKDGTLDEARVEKTTIAPGKHWGPSPEAAPDGEDFTGHVTVYLTKFTSVVYATDVALFSVNGVGMMLTKMCATNLMLDIICDPANGKRHPALVAAPGGYKT